MEIKLSELLCTKPKRNPKHSGLYGAAANFVNSLNLAFRHPTCIPQPLKLNGLEGTLHPPDSPPSCLSDRTIRVLVLVFVKSSERVWKAFCLFKLLV